MNSSIEDSEIQINNFNVTRCDRKDRKGGGVVLYVKSSFTTRTLLSYCNTVCEVLIVEVVKPHIFVVLVYRPPDASLSNFFDITSRIETTLLENNASASDILLLGDFNLPHIKWDNGHASNNATAHGRLLLAITELFYLKSN